MSESLVLTPHVSSKGTTYFYNRSSSSHHEDLINTLKTQHQARHCTITTSGMNAISSLCHAIIINQNFDPITIVYSKELYCDTPRLFTYIKAHYNCVEELITVDIKNNDEIISTFEGLKGKNVIFHTETCSNPNGYIFDCSILPIIKSIISNIYIILDNTWLTHVAFNPLVTYKDVFLVTSLTKYYSAGTAICGAILSNSEDMVMDRVSEWIRVMGIHASPHNCMLVNNMAKTIESRIKLSSALTCHIAKYLVDNGYNVEHPSIISHSSYHLGISSLCGIYPSVLTFVVKSSKTKVLKILAQPDIGIGFKTSFGSSTSKIDPWPTVVNGGVSIRLAIGFDDTKENIIIGLNNILKQI